MPEGYLTVAEAAKRLNRLPRNVRRWAQEGRIPGVLRQESPRGDYWLIPEAGLEQAYQAGVRTYRMTGRGEL